MLGKKFHIGYMWLLVSLVMIILCSTIYLVYAVSSGYNEIKLTDLLAIASIAVCASYFIACFIDDIFFPFAHEEIMTIHVINKKLRLRTIAGRGGKTVSYSYRITYRDNIYHQTGVLMCLKEHYDLIEVGDTLVCKVKGNFILDFDSE